MNKYVIPFFIYTLLLVVVALITVLMISSVSDFNEQIKLWINFGIMLTALIGAFFLFYLGKMIDSN